jgi:ribosomal protein S18 acetylase RimI-like enzyme
MPLIRPLAAKDYEVWKSMLHDFAPDWNLSPKDFKRVWKVLMNSKSVLHGWVICERKSAAPVGFMHYVLYPSTAKGLTICYVHDLYVAPAYRRRGYADAMLANLKTIGKRNKWRYIYWKTQKANKGAREFYDGIAQKADKIYYEMRF